MKQDFILVPKEPTLEMLQAFRIAIRKWLDEEGEDKDVYIAMINTAIKQFNK